jgi:hypothetical protein
MVARIKMNGVPAWTKGTEWHCDDIGIAMILEMNAGAAVVRQQSGYIPDMAAAMAYYARDHIPQVTIVHISRPPRDKKDSEGRDIVY